MFNIPHFALSSVSPTLISVSETISALFPYRALVELHISINNENNRSLVFSPMCNGYEERYLVFLSEMFCRTFYEP